MRLFHSINQLAGQSPFFDAAMRWFYVLALPAMGTLLIALLVFRRHREQLERRAAPRWKVALATLLAMALSLGLCAALNALAWRALGTENLSPRPFVIHRVNQLVVEPNDSSFPSPETMLAGVLAAALWAVFPPMALPAFAFTLMLCFARVYCGTNYPADVLGGAAAGFSLALMTLAMFRAGLPMRRHRPPENARPRFRGQFAMGALLFFALLGLSWGALATSPRYAEKCRTVMQNPARLWTSSGALDPMAIGAGMRAASSLSTQSSGVAASNPHDSTPREGEGAPDVNTPIGAAEAAGAFMTRDLPSAATTHLGGFMPHTESALLNALRAAQLPHRLVSIDVAGIDLKNPYRAAAVRFEVARGGSDERKRVVETAARIVRVALALKPPIDNVDVTGVVLNDPRKPPRDLPVFASGAIPVFTASVARRNLHLPEKAWLNAPGVDAGLWLRARSQIYMNTNLLPASDVSTQDFTVTPTPRALTPPKAKASVKKPTQKLPPQTWNVQPPRQSVTPGKPSPKPHPTAATPAMR